MLLITLGFMGLITKSSNINMKEQEDKGKELGMGGCGMEKLLTDPHALSRSEVDSAILIGREEKFRQRNELKDRVGRE